jgi:PPK2 family polyphosphate:nucleotide phosphotransferase
MKLSEIAQRFRIDKQGQFKLADYKADETLGLDKDEGKKLLKGALERLHELQERLYADDRHAMLVVLQAMDAAGKDGVIEHVIGAINPQGCEIHSFKAPNEEELAHNFLWRFMCRLPAHGRIGVFNRSYNEDVLVVRVHPEFLRNGKLAESKDIWTKRYVSIRDYEQHLARNGTCVLKFFLNLSRDEQRKRFLDRIDDPAKNWKFSMGDVRERALWPKYMEAYQDAINATAAADAPWFVVPADHKWFSRLVVAAALVDALERLNPEFPKVGKDAQKELADARKALEDDK